MERNVRDEHGQPPDAAISSEAAAAAKGLQGSITHASPGAAPTAAEHAVAALSESEEKYRTLFNSIDQGFCIIEVLFDESEKARDYRFLEANPAFEKHTGLVGAVGKTMRELAPQHEAHWFETYGKIALTGVPARFEGQAEALGRVYDVYAFRVGAPNQRRVAILFADIGERKRAEEALKEADRRKDEFLAVLAHELRNPLAPIKNGLHIAHLSSQPDSTLHRTVEMMDRQLSHLVRLVDDLLDVSRISSGRVELRRQRVGLSNVLASSIEASELMINTHQHELVVDVGKEHLFVDGDFDRLSQVFSNVLSNAAKYTDRGGRITVKMRREDSEAVVQVTDTGIGIPSAELPHVFDLFSQVRLHQGRAEGGLGIGLALVRRFLEMHGGSITAESRGPGAGSIFTVRLPVAASDTPAQDERPPSSPWPGDTARRLRILVADDNTDAAASLAMLLEMQGHEVYVAHDGIEAIEQAQSVRPEVVFLDLGMPNLDGIAVARRLRALPGSAAMLLVALTGWGQDKDRERTRGAGFDDHLVKPVDHAVLRETLQHLPRR